MKMLKILGIITTTIIAAILVIFLYMSQKNISLAEKWQKSPALPGKLFNVDNHKIYATIKGKGRKTIIIEHALGSSSPEWWKIQNSLSSNARVISYDRAGYGWSSESGTPRTSENICRELMKLLQNAEVKGPYILIGHGLGGLYMQHFAKLYQKQIAAVVLIDPMTVDYFRYKKEISVPIYNNLLNRTPNINVAAFLSKTGIIRSLKVVPYINYDPEIKDLIVENYSQEKTFNTMLNEYRKSLKKSIKQIRLIKKFPAVPLVVIHHSPEGYKEELKSFGLSYDEIEQIETISLENHKKLLKEVPGARMIYAEKSKHNIHFDEPELIINTVKELVRQ